MDYVVFVMFGSRLHAVVNVIVLLRQLMCLSITIKLAQNVSMFLSWHHLCQWNC